ncbi:TetR family transcriptional regulator [Pseudonocardiaceae bacterium YIM PH 21723]|nr:TetR family transcriptional regulator [Pseudonocardiaceae bacterium YIM PH 21723]
MKLNRDVVAKAGLNLLNEVGLAGLTMRLLAKELGVTAAAIYGHVKDKQALLDAMATQMFVEVAEQMEAPRQGVGWQDWMADRMRVYRRTMLRYRDGGRVMAGTFIDHPAFHRAGELTLRTLQDAGLDRHAMRATAPLLHYVIGFTIEQQAQSGVDYPDGNPYQDGRFEGTVDAERFPLFAEAVQGIVGWDPDEDFEYGMAVILRGITATVSNS